MGKGLKRKLVCNPFISAEEERDKIRESVLQVFRARLTSSGKGGALLVGNLDKPFKKGSTVGAWKPPIRDSTDSDIDTDSSQDRSLMPRVKKRRIKKQIVRKSKFSKPMIVTGPSTSCERKISIITENRITRCLGIFNQGRKSNTIVRDSIPAPKSVQKNLQAELEEVVNASTTSDAASLNRNNSSQASRQDDISKFNSDDAVEGKFISVSSPAASLKQTPHLFRSSKTRSSQSLVCSSPSKSDEDNSNDLLQDAPMREIACDLISSLNSKKEVLRTTDLLQETRSELQKLLLQNTVQLKEPVKISVVSGLPSVKQLLLKSLSPPQKRCTPSFNVKSTESQQEVRDETSPEECYKDAKSLLQYNNSVIALGNRKQNHHHSSASQISAEKLQLLKLKDLSTCRSRRELMSAALAQTNLLPAAPAWVERLPHLSSPPQLRATRQKDIPRLEFDCSNLLHNQWKVLKKRLPSSTVGSCLSPCHHQGVVTEFRTDPEYMPRLRDDFHTSCVTGDQLLWSCQAADTERMPPKEVGCTDLLDYLEQRENEVTLHTSGSCSECQYDWRRSPVSDDWIPGPPLSPPKKPLWNTPSPPERFYPRRLY